VWDDTNSRFGRDIENFMTVDEAFDWYDALIMGTFPGPNVFCKALADGVEILAFDSFNIPIEKYYCAGEAVFEGFANVVNTPGWIAINSLGHFKHEYATEAAARADYDNFLLAPKILIHAGVVVD
jgi:hypothetical protein